MNAEEMAKEGFYMVKCILRHGYCQGWESAGKGLEWRKLPRSPVLPLCSLLDASTLFWLTTCPRTIYESC